MLSETKPNPSVDGSVQQRQQQTVERTDPQLQAGAAAMRRSATGQLNNNALLRHPPCVNATSLLGQYPVMLPTISVLNSAQQHRLDPQVLRMSTNILQQLDPNHDVAIPDARIKLQNTELEQDNLELRRELAEVRQQFQELKLDIATNAENSGQRTFPRNGRVLQHESRSHPRQHYAGNDDNDDDDDDDNHHESVSRTSRHSSARYHADRSQANLEAMNESIRLCASHLVLTTQNASDRAKETEHARQHERTLVDQITNMAKLNSTLAERTLIMSEQNNNFSHERYQHSMFHDTLRITGKQTHNQYIMPNQYHPRALTHHHQPIRTESTVQAAWIKHLPNLLNMGLSSDNIDATVHRYAATLTGINEPLSLAEITEMKHHLYAIFQQRYSTYTHTH